jgi:hypothetical protein
MESILEMSREGISLIVIQSQLGHYAGDRVKRGDARRIRDCDLVRRRGAGRRASEVGRCG